MNSRPTLKFLSNNFHPVNARVEYRRANLVYEDVLHGTADLGLVAFPTPHKDLSVIPFANDELIIAMSPEHKLTKSGPLQSTIWRNGFHCV